MTEMLATAQQMRAVSTLPILADVDSGFGDCNVLQRAVRMYEAAGIDAIVIEDKQGPKRNSFRDGNQLEDPSVFAAKLQAAKAAQAASDFLVVARLESLIAGASLADALSRAERYHDAGADALLVHSRSSGPEEVAEFCTRWQETGRKLPLFAIPTTYHRVPAVELWAMGIRGVIYANQMIRASTRAWQDFLAVLSEYGSSSPAEDSMVSLAELFELVETERLIGDTPWQGLAGPAPAPVRSLRRSG